MFCRFSFFSAAASVLCGALVFFLSSPNVSPDSAPRFGSGYAVLAFDESQDDRAIRETLARGGLEGFISESSLEVPIDDFGFLRMVPLDAFRDSIEPFDPRDTGYAEMLRAFFVQGGQRFFFLYLDYAAAGKTARLNSHVAALLPDVPFTLTVLGQRASLFWYFALLAAACVFALIVSRSRRFFLLGLPMLLAFGWKGPSAFILAAVFVAIWELLREPLVELSAARRYRRYDYAGSGFAGLCQKLKPFRANCVLVLAFAVFAAAFSLAAGISPLPLAAAFAGLCLLYVLAFQAGSERARKNRHVHFIPVPLLPFKAKTFSLFPLLLPFGLASLLALFLPLSPLPGIVPDTPSRENGSPVNIQYLVRAESFYRHLDFQKSFSFRRLDQDAGSGPLIQYPFLRYYLGEDGLIAGSAAYAVNLWTAAPFPLEKLNRFLLNYDDAPAAGTSGFTIKGWVSVAIILAALVCNVLSPEIRPAMRPWSQSKKNKKVPVFGGARAAARKPSRQGSGGSSPQEHGRRLPS